MKQLLPGILSFVLLVSLSACSLDEEDPQFCIRNDRANKANVQIQTSGGNTININDVQPGQTTAYQSAQAGNIVTTAVIQNESVSPTFTFSAEKDKRYTIIIQAGNPPSIRVDQ